MSITRRKLFGWVAALFGGAAVAKVAPAHGDALRDLADGKLDPAHPYWAGQLAAKRDVKRVERGEEPFGPFGYDPAYPGIITFEKPTAESFKREFGVTPVSREHGVTLTSGEQAFTLNPALEAPRYGSLDERCPLHSVMGCDLGSGHSPYEYTRPDGSRYWCNGFGGGWRMTPTLEPHGTDA